MNFSVAVIARNEEKTLPRLVGSLKKFQEMGGEILVLDTGSTDTTAQVARDLGCTVFEVGDRFRIVLSDKEVEEINKKFVVGNEEPILKRGDSLFDFSSARNYLAGLATHDVIAMPDCDEIYTKFDIDVIQRLIREGAEQLEYNFVFSHDESGNEAIKFLHSKFYDRRKLRWEGIIHEVLSGEAKRVFLDESICKLEHWQNPNTNRGGYLKGLALDCFRNPHNDRNAHYFGRELVWTNRPLSAIRQLERHIEMDRWVQERAQSMIFLGDALISLNNEAEGLGWYHKAFLADSSRREALLRLAEHFYKKNDPIRVSCYATAALQIGHNGFYANNMDDYTNKPHELLYWAYWYMGLEKRKESTEHFFKAFSYKPLSSKYLHDVRFYRDLPMVSILLPTMHTRPEGLKRCLDSIEKLNYPKDKIETLVLSDEPRIGVPRRIKEGVETSRGSHIVYAADDMEFTPDSIIQAVLQSDSFGLVAFNSGKLLPDEGNVCEHFLIRRNLIPLLGGEIFDTKLSHVGVDNLLWAKCKKMGEATRLHTAKIIHHHFSQGAEFDATYQLGWSNVEQDRAILTQELAKL